MTLTPIARDDAHGLHALWTAPGVRKFLWDDRVVPEGRTDEIVAENARLFTTHHFGLWGARLRATSDLAGVGGFWPFRDQNAYELLYAVDETLWGRGLATELGQALVEYAFERLGWSELRASTDAPNVPSIRVLEKLGFVLERSAVLNGLDTLFYRRVHSRRRNR